jgi:guanylate kinase
MAGKIVVISGFSGAGKGTVIRRLMQENEGYALSVSMTTRQPRKGETDGVQYHFVTNEAFEDLIGKDGFLEHAGYVDNYYGTPRAFVEENLAAGRDVLLEIEVQGAMQIREKFPDAIMVFVAPPSAEELKKRLFGRDTESAEKAMKRLRRAAVEVESIPEYPYLVMNTDVDACAQSLQSVISGAWTPGAPDGDHTGGEIITDQAEKEAFAASFSSELEKIL